MQGLPLPGAGAQDPGEARPQGRLEPGPPHHSSGAAGVTGFTTPSRRSHAAAQGRRGRRPPGRPRPPGVSPATLGALPAPPYPRTLHRGHIKQDLLRLRCEIKTSWGLWKTYLYSLIHSPKCAITSPTCAIVTLTMAGADIKGCPCPSEVPPSSSLVSGGTTHWDHGPASATTPSTSQLPALPQQPDACLQRLCGISPWTSA